MVERGAISGHSLHYIFHKVVINTSQIIHTWHAHRHIGNYDWNTGLRRCPEKMSSLGGPTLKKKFWHHFPVITSHSLDWTKLKYKLSQYFYLTPNKITLFSELCHLEVNVFLKCVITFFFSIDYMWLLK